MWLSSSISRFTNLDEQMMYLDIAIASKVDGIVTHVLDEEKFTPLINRAVDSGIPVITVEAEAKAANAMPMWAPILSTLASKQVNWSWRQWGRRPI